MSFIASQQVNCKHAYTHKYTHRAWSCMKPWSRIWFNRKVILQEIMKSFSPLPDFRCPKKASCLTLIEQTGNPSCLYFLNRWYQGFYFLRSPQLWGKTTLKSGAWLCTFMLICVCLFWWKMTLMSLGSAQVQDGNKSIKVLGGEAPIFSKVI